LFFFKGKCNEIELIKSILIENIYYYLWSFNCLFLFTDCVQLSDFQCFFGFFSHLKIRTKAQRLTAMRELFVFLKIVDFFGIFRE